MADYNYRIGSTQLSTYAKAVRVLAEVSVGKRGNNFVIPGLEGELSFPNKLHLPANVAVEAVARFTNASGAVTHADGAPGHAHENLGELKELFGGVGALVELKRLTPHEGETVLDCEVLAEASVSQARHVFVWLCHAPSSFWRSATQSTHNTGTGTVTRLGTAPVHDMVVTFGGNGSVVTNDGLYGIEITGSSGSGIVVDCGRRTILQAGTKRDAWFRPMNNRWLRFDAASVPITVAGSVTSIAWYPKWR